LKALVLFSGGQDSATCLAKALTEHEYVETIGFRYGQRHAVELQVRERFMQELKLAFPKWGAKLGADHVFELSTLAQISNTSLTQDMAFAMQNDGLPNTFVPGRNLLFFTYAAAVAYRRDLKLLVGGMCETDYSGYPDCRDDTLKSLQATLNLGMQSRLVIDTPLMLLSKADTWSLAHKLGGDALITLMQEHTHTCYLGDRTHRHVWGYGCGACPACELREKGYTEYVKSV
jgi:7-cyano-7-deazaguanine synthase